MNDNDVNGAKGGYGHSPDPEILKAAQELRKRLKENIRENEQELKISFRLNPSLPGFKEKLLNGEILRAARLYARDTRRIELETLAQKALLKALDELYPILQIQEQKDGQDQEPGHKGHKKGQGQAAEHKKASKKKARSKEKMG